MPNLVNSVKKFKRTKNPECFIEEIYHFENKQDKINIKQWIRKIIYQLINEENYKPALGKRKKVEFGDMLNRALLELYKNTLNQFVFDEKKTDEVKRKMYLSYIKKTVEGAAKKELYKEFGYNINKGKIRRKLVVKRIFNPRKYNPEKIFISKEIKKEMHQILRSKLTDKQYDVIYGHFFEGKKLKEIAKDENCTKQNISQIKKYAFKTLREYIPDYILKSYDLEI